MKTNRAILSILTMAAVALAFYAAPGFSQIAPSCPACQSSFNGNLVNSTGIAANTSATIDMAPYEGSRVAAQVIYGSTTFGAAASFTDGAESTGNITVSNFARLLAQRATDQITISTGSGLNGAIITINGTLQVRYGPDWTTTINQSSHTAAVALAAAINTVASGVLIASAGAQGGVVYTSATAVGTAGNLDFMSSNSSTLTVTALRFVGGQDNASVTINGTALTQGSQWTAATSNNATAKSLMAAVTTQFTVLVATVPGAAGVVIYATSTANGAVFNYSLAASTGAISLSSSSLLGGINPGVTLNSSLIVSTLAVSLPVGTAVLYSTPSFLVSLGGLTNGVTYYAIPVGGFSFRLSDTSTGAAAGIALPITSTNATTTAQTFKLTPLAVTGTPGFTWQSSNDGSHWATAIAVSSVTISAFSNPPADALYDFGPYNFRYLRLSITAPTTGGINIQAPVYIRQDGIGRF